MMNRYDTERMDKGEVAELGYQYATLAKADNREDKPKISKILEEAATFNPVEMAYFCMQMMSYAPDLRLGGAWLTAFVNRLDWTPTQIEKYGWGWINGEGDEANHQWIQISELDVEGNLTEEIATIMCRDYRRVLREHPEWISAKEADANRIVNALNLAAQLNALNPNKKG